MEDLFSIFFADQLTDDVPVKLCRSDNINDELLENIVLRWVTLFCLYHG